MSLKKSILANYLSQLYVTLIGIVMVPLYITYMGAEAYGLVGFYAMLQAWFMLLDMGLTPTMARETARFRGGATDALSYRRLVRSLEGVFLVVALAGGLLMFTASGYIAEDWLQASQLPIAEVQAAIQLMAIIITMRWMCGLYRGAVSGSERLVWLGGFNATIATVRFVGVLPLLMFVGATPTIFFGFQLGVALIEMAGLFIYTYRLLPDVRHGQQLPWNWGPLKPIIKFSMSIALTSSVWVLVTQTDKLALSRILTLAEYGYFTLAVLVASGVMVIGGPVSAAIMPRMSRLEAEGDHAGLIRVYRQATQLIAVLAGSTSITVALLAETLLSAWTGDSLLARQAAPILIPYALGNGILSVAAFPYYLQYAKGDLRLHLVGNAVFVVLLVPTLIWAASTYGGVGAGYAWLGLNLISFAAWLPLVHRKFEPGLNLKWYGQDVLIILAAAAMTGYGVSSLMPQSSGRWMQLSEVIVTGLSVMLAGAVASSETRARLAGWFMPHKKSIEPHNPVSI
jgi:O-antigen/teichoic acid export membrane protein